MKYQLTLCLIFLKLSAKGQEVKKIVNHPINPGFTEEFYVLQSDKTIKHSPYIKIEAKQIGKKGFFKNNLRDSTWITYFTGYAGGPFIKLEGKYKEGKKVGIWKEWDWAGNQLVLRNSGEYKNGERFGVWQYYDGKGRVRKVFDFNSGQVYLAPEIDSSLQKEPYGYKSDLIDHQPTVLKTEGAEESEYRFRNRDHNHIEVNPNEKCEVKISYIIDKNGNETALKIESTNDTACGKDLFNYFKVNPLKWNPGLLNGKPVEVKVIQSYRY